MLQLAVARRKEQLKSYFNRAILGPKLLAFSDWAMALADDRLKDKQKAMTNPDKKGRAG